MRIAPWKLFGPRRKEVAGGVAMAAGKIVEYGDKMHPRFFEISTSKCLHANQPQAKRISSKVAAMAGSCALAIGAVIFYRLRELLAALLLFSVIIVTAFIAVLIFWLVGEVVYEAASRMEKHLTRIAARHSLAWSRTLAAYIHRSPH